MSMPFGFHRFLAEVAAHEFNQRNTDAPIEWFGVIGSFFCSALARSFP